jgi:hypothetical protein
MTDRITLRLTLDVTYDLNDTKPGDLIDNLLDIPTRASREGWLTLDTDAEVVVADPQVIYKVEP